MSGSGFGTGLKHNPARYEWNGEIHPISDNGLTFDIHLSLAESLTEAPNLVLWLGPLSTMSDRQALTWRRTFLGGPTRNVQGLAGNDLPALYFFDPATQIETILAYDSLTLSWAVGRLLTLQCREVWEYGDVARYGVGLIGAHGPFPAGQHQFRWHLWQRASSGLTEPWEAISRLVDTIAPLINGYAMRLPGVISWEEVAMGTLQDLQQPEQAWVEVPGTEGPSLGLRAYVKDTPQLYKARDDHFELMTIADVLAPLLLYLRLHPDAQAEGFAKRLLRSLNGFHDPLHHYIGNRYPVHADDTLTDLWYFFENGIIKLAWISIASGDNTLLPILLDGMRGASDLARRVNYCFPLFAEYGNPSGPLPFGTASNYSVAGLYAFGALLVAGQSNYQEYQKEARRSLWALRHLPLEMMYHEPQQLGFGAAAAALLGQHGDNEMRQLADWLVRAQLRMAYWHDDPHALSHGYQVRGLFQACASLLYPAFKEEVESILPWLILLRQGLGPTELMLKFMNLARQQSFAFFEPYLTGHEGDSSFIPYENLGTTELPERGSIGKEIYGAGEVFWLYLIFEALAYANDPEICVIYLDLLESATLVAFPPQRRRFIVYNPRVEAWEGMIHFRYLAPRKYSLIVKDAGIRKEFETITLETSLSLRLSPQQWCEIELIPIDSR
jgi:hypothetical protein